MSAAPWREPEPRASAPVTAPTLANFEAVVALAAEKRDIQVRHALEQFVRPVSMQEGRLEIALAEGAPTGLSHTLSAKLHEWTGKRWFVTVVKGPGAPTIAEKRAASQSALEQDVRNDPLVQAVLQRFPGAEIVGVRRRGEMPSAEQAEAAEFEPTPDMPPDPPDEDRLD